MSEAKESKKFEQVAVFESNPKWEEYIRRESELYSRADDVRSAFARDYTRILHSTAYRRLKHKTQVFYNIDNDHICTRMEHVAHVESVSYTIANSLGLNSELTKAIAMGHDLGHAPFGHQGESVINKLTQQYLGTSFWHEKNGLYFVDNMELLEDNSKISRNLDLTYAVRDGIISHCGEVDQDVLRPREELIDLALFQKSGEYMPASWEACVVKVADKIAYVGRDIEDAICLGFLEEQDEKELLQLAGVDQNKVINTTVIMHDVIIDICNHSDPEKGLTFSDACLQKLNAVKKFNYQHIYLNKRFHAYLRYTELVISEIFEALMNTYDASGNQLHWQKMEKEKRFSPILMKDFGEWLAKYCEIEVVPEELKPMANRCENKKIYGMLADEKIYCRAVIDFISGMTDRYAIKVFQELLTY